MHILQIGCNTGKDEHSDAIKKAKSAILVDANPKCIEKIKETYQDLSHIIYETAAVIPVDIKGRKIKLFQEEEKETSGWASVYPNFVKAHCHHSNLKFFEAKTTTPSKLLRKYPKTDYLIIDTEGLDLLNILSIDGMLFKDIKKLTFEFIHCDGIVNAGPKLNSLIYYLKSLGFKNISKKSYNLYCSK
jgi:FkbM family methyltransferase